MEGEKEKGKGISSLPPPFLLLSLSLLLSYRTLMHMHKTSIVLSEDQGRADDLQKM